ncbi:Nif3-like dinuclear metal center hexameric protein, partial [Psychromonas aquatilis]
MLNRKLANKLAQYLEIHQFKDYCPNGLQVEGREQIQKIVSGVTANQALIDAAMEFNADAIVVHHGYFWKG